MLCLADNTAAHTGVPAAEPSDSGLASTDAPDSAQLASGYDNTSSPDASGVERRRSQRRRVAVSRGEDADDGEVSLPEESRPEAEPAPRHRKVLLLPLSLSEAPSPLCQVPCTRHVSLS